MQVFSIHKLSESVEMCSKAPLLATMHDAGRSSQSHSSRSANGTITSSSTALTFWKASAGVVDCKADSAVHDESVDLAANIDALITAIAALEKGVAMSSFLKSAVMKFGPDAGENRLPA